MMLGTGIRVLAGAMVGVIAGAAATLAVQPGKVRTRSRPLARPQTVNVSDPVRSPARPTTFLAWTHGGLPEGFEGSVERLDDVKRLVVVANDNTWLTGSLSAQGQVVDDLPKPYAIPLDVSAARPEALAPFLPPVDRGVVVDLEAGEGVLGASSAKLRGLGPGGVLFFGRRAIEIAAVLPDELVGAAELLVSRETGRRIGVTRDRYALIETRRPATSRRLEETLAPALADAPARVRAPGETPFLRHGDAVLPPVLIKLLFGEFAARPMPGRPGFLEIDPAWVRTHIATRRLPLLGTVTCNRALIPQIRGAMLQLRELGLASTVRSFSGCYSARFVNRVPTATLSHHSWGIAFDVNVPQNPFGATPHQDPGLVEVLEDWGFIWGGTFLVPDGMHFEYHRPPPW